MPRRSCSIATLFLSLFLRVEGSVFGAGPEVAAPYVPLQPPVLTLSPSSSPAPLPSDRYGFLDLLDHRSSYGTYWFPEPLRSDEGDIDNEIRLDYFHAEKKHRQLDSIKTEIEYSIGVLTLEVAGGYAADRTGSAESGGGFVGQREEGFTNLEVAARYPLIQYVSADGVFDDTWVVGLEAAPPTHTKVSKDTEIVPKLFNLLRVGEHLSVQTGVGVSTVVGSEARGESNLEYNVVTGYEITKGQLTLPLVVATLPILEVNGETGMNHAGRGNTALLGTVGFRMEFEHMGRFMPKIGLGYTFPLDKGGREQLDWGVVTSLIFEY